jgi:hypothetical protein
MVRARILLGVLLCSWFVTFPGAAQEPRTLRATAGDGVVDLQWTPPSLDSDEVVPCYRVYRDTSSIPDDDPQDFTDRRIAAVDAPATPPSFSDTTVTNGVTYFYRVTAEILEQNDGDVGTTCGDEDADESDFSNEVSATPAAPVSITIGRPRTPVTEPVDAGAPVEVEATVTGAAPGTVDLRYRRGGRPAFASVSMQAAGARFTATIPGDSVTARGVEFFVAALDDRGAPVRAPENDEASVVVVSETQSFDQTGGTAQSAYRLVSFPGRVEDARLSALFEDTLGPPDDTQWRLFDVGDGALDGPEDYVEQTDMTATLNPGQALWLITRSTATLDSGKSTSVRTDEPFRIPLQNGWNLVANPFAFDVPRANLRVDGTSAGLQDVFGYDGTFVPITAGDALAPYRGYLVRLEGGASGTLSVVPHLDVGLTASSARAAPDLSWQMNVAARIDRARDLHNVLGVAPAARDGAGAEDGHEPPPVGQYVSVAFAPPGAGGQRFWRDVRPPGRRLTEWTVTVRTNVAGIVRLDASGLQQLPDDRTAWLVDPVHGLAQDLQRSPTYRFSAAGHETTRRLRVLVGAPDAVRAAVGSRADTPATVELEAPSPHPIQDHATLRYGLPSRANVTLAVYDLLGRRVATLADHRDTPAGVHTLSWSAQTGSLASGTYILRLDADGVSRSRRIVVVR